MGARVGYSQAARNFISVFLEDPPTLAGDVETEVPATKIGRTQLVDQQAADAALAALASNTFYWYWLVRGDGFDVTAWLVNDFLRALEEIDGESYGLLAEFGRVLSDHRNEALQFKRNAGKYVGNYNYQRLPILLTHVDYVLLAALGIDASLSDAMVAGVRRILALNEFAGERNIPDYVHARFPAPIHQGHDDDLVMRRARRWASTQLGIDDDRILTVAAASRSAWATASG